MQKILLKCLVAFTFVAFFASAFIMIKKVAPFEVQRLLSKNHPIRQAYEAYLKKFDDSKAAFVLLQSDQILETGTTLRLSRELDDFLHDQPQLQDAVGPINAKYLRYENENFFLEPFFVGGKLTTEGKAKLEAEMWKNTLLSEDGKAFMVSFNFADTLPVKDEKMVVDNIDSFLIQIERQNPGIKAHMLGTKIASAAFLQEMGFNLKIITPLLLLCIGFFLYFVYRSWQILFWNFVVMIICYVTTLILIIFVEGGLGPYSNFALMFSFIVATTDLIHFFGRYQRLSGPSSERLTEALRIAYVPCLLTSLTTAAGFVALILNENLPIRYFGLYCSFACVLEFVVIFHMLPPILKLFNFSAANRELNLTGTIQSYWNILAKYSKALVAFALIFVLCGGALTGLIYVDDNFYTKFNSEHKLSQALAAFTDKFHFAGSIDVVIRPIQGEPVLTEANINIMREFEQELLNHPLVSHLASFRQINDELNDEIRLHSKSPIKPQELNKSIIEMLSATGSLKDFYSEDAQELRMIVFLKSLATEDFVVVTQAINDLKSKYANQLNFELSGFAVIRNYINSNVIKNFFESFALSFFLTYLCFVYLYRNLLWSLLALLPNAMPLLIISGLMGLFKVPVDSNLAILICVAFGVSGDNTVHLTYVMQQNPGASSTYKESLFLAMQQIGLALFATSAIFLCSLPCFLMGHLKLFQQIAIFLSLSFVMAFVADLFVFPAFHILFKKKPSLGGVSKD